MPSHRCKLVSKSLSSIECEKQCSLKNQRTPSYKEADEVWGELHQVYYFWGFDKGRRFARFHIRKPELKKILTDIKYNFETEKWSSAKSNKTIESRMWALGASSKAPYYPTLEHSVTYRIWEYGNGTFEQQFIPITSNFSNYYFCENDLTPSGPDKLILAKQKCKPEKLASFLTKAQMQVVHKNGYAPDTRQFWTDAELLNETFYMMDKEPVSKAFLFKSNRLFNGYVSMDENMLVMLHKL